MPEATGHDPGGDPLDHVRDAIGRWIRHHREFLGLSQESLRRRLHDRGVRVSQSTLSRWERGEIGPPVEVLPALSRCLGTPLATLEELVSLELARTGDTVDLTGTTFGKLEEQGDELAGAGDLAGAVRYYQAAHDLLALGSETVSPEAQAMLLVKLSWAHQHLWEIDAARAVLRRLSDLDPLPRDIAFRGLIQHLVLEHRFGDHEAARVFAMAIEAELDQQAPPERAGGLQVLGWWAFVRDRFDEARDRFARAIPLWEERGNLLEATRALAQYAFCLARTGQPEEGTRLAARAVSTARDQLRAVDVEILALRLHGRILADRGDPTSALRDLERAAALARRAGLAAEEFITLWTALPLAGPDSGRHERRLKRLLRHVHPRLPEAREFVEAGLARTTEGEEER